MIDHIDKGIENETISFDELVSEIEEMERMLNEVEEILKNVLKWNNLSLETLGFNSKIFSTPEYNPNQQYNSPQQYGAASKNSGCMSVIAVLIVIIWVLV